MKFFLFLTFSICFFQISKSQKLTNEQIAELVEDYKSDIRGPYYRIKWFCEDGSIRDAKNPCPDTIGGGIQHASFKESALNLRRNNNLYFAEILAANEVYPFLDKDNYFNRLKQYQVNKYLASVDNGWVLQKGKFYRGSIQSEDEQAWGRFFFETILKDNQLIEQNFYLLRQALKDIPHNGDTNTAQLMRSQSKKISEAYNDFMDLRIKIHGQPEATDVSKVEMFYNEHKYNLDIELRNDFRELMQTMKSHYKPLDLQALTTKIKNLPRGTTTQYLTSFLEANNSSNLNDLINNVSEALSEIRKGILTYSSSKERLVLLDISNDLEHYLLTTVQEWHPKSLQESMQKISALICAANGTGLIENWEYASIENKLNSISSKENLTIAELSEFITISRSAVEWSAALTKANYNDVVETYSAFEPLAYGFIDDRVRSSVALSLGESVSQLGRFLAELTDIKNEVLDIESSSSFRGLNPGYAYGKLVVVDANPDTIEVNPKNIYVFKRPPADLKPVAGIMTVSEGNLVSHVQLLSRNLGIPNAALSYGNLKALKPYDGKNVFYAVSSKGNVKLKLEHNMTKREKALFDEKELTKAVIEVPTNQIRLGKKTVMNMREVDADDSGKVCGPKAANLGELKKMFPDNVVEGIIIPFGIFKMHMNQQMPGESKTYWTFLNDVFSKASQMSKEGIAEREIEKFQLQSLEKLHKAIVNIKLLPNFVSDLKFQFTTAFGGNIGDVPVFLRSDTNMEDLEEFTGAGLNLTLFNIKKEKEILNGIKRVWASAYTERSFKWRQKFLSNPENVFPSILIIPSVDVDYSGVMITKDINSGNNNDLTVAFSRGAGGAVDGQSAETRLITKSNNVLLSPARQPDYIRLPSSGGTERHYTGFDSPILNYKNIVDIRNIAKRITDKLNANTNTNNSKVYDVEFGFKDNKLWLFQIRPFVENSAAKSSEYLQSITPKIDNTKVVNHNLKI